MAQEDQGISIEEENRMVLERLEELKKNMKTTYQKESILNKELRPLLGDCITDFMLQNGFCSAPASTTHHGNYEGGLFEHSLTVALCLQKYTDRLGLSWEKADSPIRVGMLHDLCKIDYYKKVIDVPEALDIETLSTVPREFHYEWDDTPLVKGHGDKSVIYALRYGCHLTEEEIACIIYHMGAFTNREKWKDYDNAIKKYPNVLFTHTADMEASQIHGC